MTPKPDVSAERKQQIYQAALACFSRKGYHQTTMDDIVAESGLSKGALYWYFKGKKELFLSLFNELMAQFGAEWESIAALEGVNATGRLRASLEFFRAGMEPMVPFFGVMMEAWALTRHDEDVETLVGEFYKPYVEIMQAIIEEGVASGEFLVTSTRAASMVILTLFDGITLAMAAGMWEHDWDEMIDAAEELVLRGLGVNVQDDE
jgi:AcrR family transcriptional regulator